MPAGDDKSRPNLIGPHGGYRELKSYQNAEIVYDGTVVFCDRFVSRHSRTHDQMVQAARSGKQNIAEGSMASGTSKKTELKLVGVARASLEELLLDYQDFLRQRGRGRGAMIRDLWMFINASIMYIKTGKEESYGESVFAPQARTVGSRETESGQEDIGSKN